MKFKLKTNDYREYRGYVFAWGKPTEIRDRGTIEALTGHPDFDEVKDIPGNGSASKTIKLPKRSSKRDEAVL